MFSLAQLHSEHSALVAKLSRYSFFDASQLIAGFSLLPEFHANTVRIEALQHLVAMSCSGQVKPERNDLIEWAKQLDESPLAQMEDPVEDVFIGYVNSAFGGFRVVRGIFADGDFWLERLLAFLEEKQNFPSFENAIKQALPLLQISEALINRVGLSRYCVGGGKPAFEIQIPQWRKIKPFFEAVHFSDLELAELNIDEELLREFILTNDEKSKLAGQSIWNSSLERFPLIKMDGGINVISPSNLLRAVIRSLLESITKSGIGGWGDMFFHQETASTFVNLIARRLEIKPLNIHPPAWPDELPSMMPFTGYFDYGKPVLMLSHCIPISKSASDFNGFESFTDEEKNHFQNYLRKCMSELEEVQGFSGGMVLISLGSIGISTSFSLSILKDNWHIHTASLPDWLTLTGDDECTAMRLWKLGIHEAVLKRHGTKTINLAGLLNLYAHWKSNGFRIIPRNKDGRSVALLYISDDCATSFRVATKRERDVHCVRSHDKLRWVKLQNRNFRSMFKEDRGIPIYRDYESASSGRLVSCVFSQHTHWWVTALGRYESQALSNLAFQLWECVEGWAARIIPVAEREWPTLTEKSIEIRVELKNLVSWKRYENSHDAIPSEDLSFAVNRDTNCISVIIPEGFMQKFKTPKNVAERSIVSSILKSIAEMCDEPLGDEKCVALSREVTRNDDARFFHVVTTHNVVQILAEKRRPEPLFISEEDYSFAQAGLADLVTKAENVKELVGMEDCKKFLGDAVAKIWERVEDQLRPFDRESVVMRCFQAFDAIEHDEQHWNMTSRSMLAMHNDKEAVYEVLSNRRGDRAKASVCNRLIVETGQYACAIQNGRHFTEADHLMVLSNMTLLIKLANDRDAIAGGFMEPKIRFSENGELDVDERFYAKIISRYFSEKGRAASDEASAEYEDYFSGGEQSQEIDDDQIESALDEFDKVFIPEFGFNIRLLLKTREEWKHMAIMTKTSGGLLNEEVVLKLLAVCGFSVQESEAFLSCFTLPIRSAWNKDLPRGCREVDVHPWRHRRQLSLLMRPLVQASISPRSWLISVPLFDKYIKFWLGNLEHAHFPKEFFKSSEMQIFVGNVANKLGHKFAEKVSKAFAASGYQIHLELELTCLGASKKLGFGDLDVFAWSKASGRVYAIECKRLLTANSVRQVVQRLEDFRGSRKERDSLGRHLRRFDWLKKNLDSVSNFTGIPAADIRLSSLLITSEIVPMQFYSEMNFPTSQVVPYDEIEERLRSDGKI